MEPYGLFTVQWTTGNPDTSFVYFERGSNLVTYFNWTPIFEWFLVGCGSKNRHEKDMFESDWTTFSKCVIYSRFNSQHNWGDVYDHLTRKRIFTSIMNKIFIRALKNMRKWLWP